MPWPLVLVEVENGKAPEKPGAIFKWEQLGGHEEWFVRLPNGGIWNVYGPSSDGTPWDVTGAPPKITARPSINYLQRGSRPGYHGWLTDGILSDDLEGRVYE